jgi:hypothetical protein
MEISRKLVADVKVPTFALARAAARSLTVLSMLAVGAEKYTHCQS